MSESPFNPFFNREETLAIFFEKFNVNNFYLARNAVLGLYSAGITTGLAVSIGSQISHTVPVFHGYQLLHSVGTLNLAGENLDEYMAKNLNISKEIAREAKEAVGYVALDFEQEKQKGVKKTYTPPNGSPIAVDEFSFKIPEILFDPNSAGISSIGIQKTASNSITQINGEDFKKNLYANIVLMGGSSLFPGFADRMLKEISGLAPDGMKLKIIAPPERKYSEFIGGSILASLSNFQ